MTKALTMRLVVISGFMLIVLAYALFFAQRAQSGVEKKSVRCAVSSVSFTVEVDTKVVKFTRISVCSNGGAFAGGRVVRRR